MRFSQAHRAGPAAFDQRLEEDLALPVFAMLDQRFGGAVREQRKVAPGQVGGVDHFLQRNPGGMRQALSAELRRRGQAGPAAVDVLHIGLLEARSEEHTSELQSLMRISYAV